MVLLCPLFTNLLKVGTFSTFKKTKEMNNQKVENIY